MNIFDEERNSIGNYVFMAVFGFTAMLMLIVSWKARPGHHLSVLFELPSRLKPRWLCVFYFLWVYDWFVLWKRFPKYIPADETAPKVYRVSWVVLVVIAVLRIYLPQGQPHLYRVLMFSHDGKVFWRNIAALFGFSFPAVCLGAILTTAADIMGLASSDPIDRELSHRIEWEQSVDHLKFMKKAVWEGLAGCRKTPGPQGRSLF